MYLQMDPLDNPLSTHPIPPGSQFSKEPYPSAWFGFIENPDLQFGSGSFPTRTRTGSDGPEPLLTLDLSGITSVAHPPEIFDNRQSFG